MQKTHFPNHDAAILTRLTGLEQSEITLATAKGLLALTFSSSDKARMHELAEKSRAGSLMPDEVGEIEAYSRISSLIGILKSKARRSLKLRASNSKTNSQ